MRDFAKRRGKPDLRRFILNICGLLVLLFITFMMARAAWGMYGKFTEAAQSDELSQKKLADLTAQQSQVSASVQSLSSERGIEGQVRERFGVAKPGEGQIEIVRDSAPTSTPQTPKPNPFMRVWQALFGWL